MFDKYDAAQKELKDEKALRGNAQMIMKQRKSSPRKIPPMTLGGLRSSALVLLHASAVYTFILSVFMG